jgi:hypothetical protein
MTDGKYNPDTDSVDGTTVESVPREVILKRQEVWKQQLISIQEKLDANQLLIDALPADKQPFPPINQPPITNVSI